MGEKWPDTRTTPKESEFALRIGYLIDTNHGYYGQPLPDPDKAADALDTMIEEGILAE